MAEGGGSIGELFVELFFKADDIKLKDFMHSISELNLGSVMATLGLGAMYEIISKIMTTADQSAHSINFFGETTGQSTQKMQQWNEQAKEMGVNTDNLISKSVSMMKSKTSQWLFSGTGPTGAEAAAYGLLGVNPLDTDKFKQLNDIMEAISKQPQERRLGLLNALGLPEDYMILINHLKEFQMGAANQLSNDPTRLKELAKYSEAIARSTYEWKILLGEAAEALTPLLIKINRILDFILKVEDKLKIFKFLFATPLLDLTMGNIPTGGLSKANMGGNTIAQTNNVYIKANDTEGVVKELEQFHRKKLIETYDQLYNQVH